MDKCPPVMAMGARCMDNGYGFYWCPGRTPIYVRPDGTIIRHEVVDKLPYLVEPAGWSY